MADDKPENPCFLVRRISDGEVFAVPERHYRDRLADENFEDAGSTDLSVDAVPLNDNLDLPKIEALKKAGFRRVGDLRGLSVDELSDVEGVGEKSAEKILATLPPRNPDR